MGTYREIVAAVTTAQTDIAWKRGTTNDTEKKIAGQLRLVWERIEHTLNPNHASDVPLKCLPQRAADTDTARRVIGDHVFVASDDRGTAFGFDVSLSAGGLTEKVSFDLYSVPRHGALFTWYIRIDGKAQSPELCTAEQPRDFDPERQAGLVVGKLKDKLVTKASL